MNKVRQPASVLKSYYIFNDYLSAKKVSNGVKFVVDLFEPKFICLMDYNKKMLIMNLMS